jgi:hypothetical protein
LEVASATRRVRVPRDGRPDIDRDEIAVNDHQRQLNGADHLDKHRDLIQLKVAAALAVLDGRLDLNAEDWQLAHQVVATSTQVREGLADHLQAEADQKEKATARRLAGRRTNSVLTTVPGPDN